MVNLVPAVLRERGLTWGELARRAVLPPHRLARLRAPGANPPLALAERVAATLGVPIERLWRLRRPR